MHCGLSRGVPRANNDDFFGFARLRLADGGAIKNTCSEETVETRHFKPPIRHACRNNHRTSLDLSGPGEVKYAELSVDAKPRRRSKYNRNSEPPDLFERPPCKLAAAHATRESK